MQKESYEQYTKRIEGLANPVILSREDWEKETNPPQVVEEAPEPEPKQQQFSSAEQTHMAVMAEEARKSEQYKIRPANPLDIAFPKIGLESTENTLKVRESSEEAFRALQAQAEEDRRASEERQRKLEKKLAEQEHLSEIAKNAYIADQIRAGRQVQ